MSYLKSLTQLCERVILKNKIKALARSIVREDLTAIKKHSEFGISFKDNRGNTPLHYAVLSNNVDMVRILLKVKPDLEIKNTFHQTPLMLTCEVCSTKNPYYQIIVTPQDDDKTRKQKCFEIVQLLVEAGANIHTKDKNETTPIIKATLKENEFIVQYLLGHSDIYQKDNKNGTVTAYAMECNNQNLIKIIIENMNSEEFTDFLQYVKTLRSIIKYNTIEELTALKDKIDSVKRKYCLEQMLGFKIGKSKQVKI